MTDTSPAHSDPLAELESKTSHLLKTLGPGLLWAGASIGVSHLVQSTRAGASYGFILIWLVVLAMIVKYPFFEYGPRYAAATGNSLLEGYKKLGAWAMTFFLIMTIGTMFAVEAAVTIVTAGLASQILPIGISPLAWSAILLAICVGVLIYGQYALLDSAIKVIIVVLALSTVVAVITAIIHGSNVQPDFEMPVLWSVAGISFVVALMGWMPCPIDVAVWHSLWTLERKKQTGHTPSLKHVQFDFNLGYIGTGFLALGFLTLGALVMFGTGESFASSGGKFANQLISLYSTTLGSWSRPVILIAAFTTMFSTTLTVTDAYPRVLSRSTALLMGKKPDHLRSTRYYWIWMGLVVLGALFILGLFTSTMTILVDIATTLSFVTAPVFAIMNYRVLTGSDVPAESQPDRILKIWSWIGIIFLSGFTLGFLYWRFF